MKILLRTHPSKKWEIVDSAEYNAEKELQKLLEEDPSLISVSELREGVSPLIVGVREVGLPGSGSTDLLAFSPAGDIAVVECKLAANAEIKRKVIAQVLEYGAYLWNMTYDELNKLIFTRTGKNLAELISEAAGDPSWNEEDFRASIQNNLVNGTFILVIAVDEMNDELSQTIRFVNSCGRPGFSFVALEMHRYQKGVTEILVPYLFAPTTDVKPSQHGGPRKQWTENQFFEKASTSLSPEVTAVIQDIYNWSKNRASRVWFGTGTETGSFTFHCVANKQTISIFSVYTTGVLIINYGWLIQRVPIEKLEQFHASLTTLPGFRSIPADFNRWPSVRIEDVFLKKPDVLSQFKSIVEEFINQFPFSE